VEAFKDTNHTNRIRACLFTELQMSPFWQQLGGNLRNLIFRTRKLRQDILALARILYPIT
ncbi:DUF489 family protein, partial [Klebsiella pneumoniae]|uniref:DUF489 family protein n=1 Tax=Klebsiella pneumoniae TaxID=573 RepID=UPI003137371E